MEWLVMAAFGAFAGSLIGLLPYFVAQARGRATEGQQMIAACAVAGAILGLVLAAPLALGLTAYLLAQPRRTPDTEADMTPTPR